MFTSEFDHLLTAAKEMYPDDSPEEVFEVADNQWFVINSTIEEICVRFPHVTPECAADMKEVFTRLSDATA